MTGYKKLPVGIESFEEIRKEDFYYVDKTRLIEQLLENWSKVTLFTRPRRFGKTLNMSMLRSFFETGTDKTLFDGLYISDNEALCSQYMGRYPVIFLSLKGVDGLNYTEAEYRLKELIGTEASRMNYLTDSDKLSDNDKARYMAISDMTNGKYSMDTDILVSSLQTLSELLYKHHSKKTVILIDEYDVPLDKAFQHGYYGEMVSLLRGFLGQALKTNDYLQFAVLTGCLRISRESIFTGLNNFKVYSVTDVRHDEQFGFTDDEIKNMLDEYGFQEHYPKVKEWYDGYRFGNADIYCPWDVINYVDDLLSNPDIEPRPYWINSSGNDLLKRLIERADNTTKDEIEELVAGKEVAKNIRLDLTYDEIESSIDNIWSVLFTTGYLTQNGKLPDGAYKLIIPNREIQEVFKLQIWEWFNRVVARQNAVTEKINRGFLNGDEKDIEYELTIFLDETISILDTKARNEQKENFYHGILLGILKSYPSWVVKSNQEAGDGFADIMLRPKNPDMGIIIELKYAHSYAELDQACDKALEQIHDRRYDQALREDGRNEILCYGIAFFKKRCRVIVERMD